MKKARLFLAVVGLALIGALGTLGLAATTDSEDVTVSATVARGVSLAVDDTAIDVSVSTASAESFTTGAYPATATDRNHVTLTARHNGRNQGWHITVKSNGDFSNGASSALTVGQLRYNIAGQGVDQATTGFTSMTASDVEIADEATAGCTWQGGVVPVYFLVALTGDEEAGTYNCPIQFTISVTP